MEKILPFFQNEFQLCLTGKADLKQELTKYLSKWNWQKSIEDLLDYWFENENTLNKQMLENIKNLRDNGIRCYLNTNNEKYRAQYLFEKLNLKNSFDDIFSSAQLGVKKPQIKFWEAIHNSLNKPNKSEILVWDDDEENVKSAQDFGFQAEFYSDFDNYEKLLIKLVGIDFYPSKNKILNIKPKK